LSNFDNLALVFSQTDYLLEIPAAELDQITNLGNQQVTTLFTTTDLLNESHAREIDRLPHCGNLSPWLDRETALLEVIEGALARSNASRRASSGVEGAAKR
jgi:hypothetical protein